jgi:polyisoprenoid-binding protein YceI
MNTDHRFPTSLACGAAFAALLTVSLAAAAAKLNKTGASSTSFKVAGPAGLSIEGRTADMTVVDDGTTVTITVPLGNLSTGIGLRDEHTKRALETDKYATVSLALARAQLKFPGAGAESSGDAKGALLLHGQTKDVTVHYTAKNAGGTIAVAGSMRINMKEFGVNPPSYLGVSVKPDVDVNTGFQATNN